MHCVGLSLDYWDNVKDAISEALTEDCGRITAKDIKDAVEARKMQLWAIHDNDMYAVMVTELVNYSQMRVARIVTVTGHDMDLWLDTLIDTISQWGAENGAHALEFVGRLGWKKVLESKGFINPQVMMTRFITS